MFALFSSLFYFIGVLLTLHCEWNKKITKAEEFYVLGEFRVWMTKENGKLDCEGLFWEGL